MRAFLPTTVAREDIELMLEVAARAPSGSNTQPWKAYVLTGNIKQRLSSEILVTLADPAKADEITEEYRYYPHNWVSPYIDRRRKVGFGLYNLLGLGRDDKAAMQAQHERNFIFFDAPVGIIFTIDRTMNTGSWLDFGCFLQSFMVAARGRGIPETEVIMCGLALGYADMSKIENSLISEREPVSEFAKFLE
eukprot:gene4041-4092_t